MRYEKKQEKGEWNQSLNLKPNSVIEIYEVTQNLFSSLQKVPAFAVRRLFAAWLSWLERSVRTGRHIGLLRISHSAKREWKHIYDKRKQGSKKCFIALKFDLQIKYL